jgi:pyruvate/2-oxoglutarate dehydrogenase complex dihydrolipoamide acyltransferase (E2) component
MTRLVSLRQAYKDAVKEKYGVKLTYMPFLIKATVWALKEHPWVNASIVEDQIVVKRYYHIGMAVARDLGLIVPVIHDADQKTLLEIAKEVEDLAERARQDKLTLPEIQGGTFTITNAGGYGAILSAPVINWPEVAILGVHQIQERPVVVNHEVAVRQMMYLSLSFDHRLVDGSLAVQFLQRIKHYLENPDQWLVDVMLNVI